MYQLNPVREFYNYNKNEVPGESIVAPVTGTMAASAASAASVAPLIPVIDRKWSFFGSPQELPTEYADIKLRNGQKLGDYLKSRNIKFSRTANGVGPYFNPINNELNLAVKDKYRSKWDKSLLAHELGHSEKMAKVNGKIPKSVYVYELSKQLTGLAAFIQLVNCFNSDDESRRKIGKSVSIAGGASSIPMIAEEIGASMRGTKLMQLKGKDKAKAFMGIASYVTLALSPAIMYTVSEKTRSFLRNLRKIKDENPEVQQKIEEFKNQDIKVKV